MCQNILEVNYKLAILISLMNSVLNLKKMMLDEKINKHFYLNKEAIEKLEIIKQEKRLKTNNEVIEYLINIYEKKNDNSDIEKVFKKLSFIDKQSQIILWQSSLLLNFSR